MGAGRRAGAPSTASRRSAFDTEGVPRVPAAADGPDGVPVSCAVVQVRPAPPSPSPSGHSGAVATIFNVVTLAAYRNRGYAAACFDALLDWVDARSDVRMAELLATPEGRRLYSSRGFVTHPHPLMRRRGIPRSL